MFTDILLLLIGIAILCVGADWLVRGASRIALGLNVRPVIVGVTIVALGTSAPELAVCLKAAIEGSGVLATGNIVGSNIANICLILGAAAVIKPMQIDRKLLTVDIPFLVIVSVVFWVLSCDGEFARLDGGILLTLLVGYYAYLVRSTLNDRRTAVLTAQQSKAESDEVKKSSGGVLFSVGMIVLGLAGLVYGADLLVASAVAIARALGISKLFIAITMVAVGTSLPELATAVVAAIRGESDICYGNVIGSNIMNILLIIGVTALILPLSIDAEMLTVHFPVMLLFTATLLPLLWRRFVISRVEGAALLLCYGAYIYVAYLTGSVV